MASPTTPGDGPLFDPTGRWVWTPSGWQRFDGATSSHSLGSSRPTANVVPEARAVLAQPVVRAVLVFGLIGLVIVVWSSNFGEGARRDAYLQALADGGVIYQSAVHDSSQTPRWVVEGENVCTMQKNGDDTTEIRQNIATWTGTTPSAADVVVASAEKYIC